MHYIFIFSHLSDCVFRTSLPWIECWECFDLCILFNIFHFSSRKRHVPCVGTGSGVWVAKVSSVSTAVSPSTNVVTSCTRWPVGEPRLVFTIVYFTAANLFLIRELHFESKFFMILISLSEVAFLDRLEEGVAVGS